MRMKQLQRGSMRHYIANRDTFATMAAPLLTKDGLLPCSQIRVVFGSDDYELTLAADHDIALFPVPESDFVTAYLVDRPELWRYASLRVDCVPAIWGSAPAFGVPFKRAVEIALQRGYMKSRYFLPDTERNGHHETLLLQLDHASDSTGEWLQLQVWQFSPGSTYAHYVHALSRDFQSHLAHLDGATIKFSEADLQILLRQSRKVKGERYEKHFRVDGIIPVEDMHGLATAFLPGEELYNEAFRVEVLEDA